VLEKELISIISLHKRFSLASVGVWLFLSILQLFLISEMIRIDEAYFLFVMSIPMLFGAGVVHLYRKFSSMTSLFSSVDVDVRLSLLLLLAAVILQTFGMDDSDSFRQAFVLVTSFMPGVMWMLVVSVLISKVKLESKNNLSCKIMEHILFTAVFMWTLWLLYAVYKEGYLYMGVISNVLVCCVPFFVNFINRDVESRISDLLESQVFRDELTGLGNRKALYRGFDEIKKDASDDKSLFMMVVDIDYFKQYNDRYGHVKGDDCLVFVSRTLEEIFPDFKVIRFGGEEFVIFGLVDNSQIDAVEQSKFIQAWLRGEMTLDYEHLSAPSKLLSLSGGYGVFAQSYVKVNNAKSLISLADEALYKAKVDRQSLVKV